MRFRRDFYFKDGPYRQVIEGVAAALAMHESMIKITGVSGVGKSVMCRRIQRVIEKNNHPVFFFDVVASNPQELRDSIRAKLGMPKGRNLIHQITNYIHSLEGKKSRLVLIFDDVHLMTDQTLEELSLLTNIQSDPDNLSQILLCGCPELNERLEKERFRSLRQHISHSVTISPLQQETVAAFVRYYLAKKDLQAWFLDDSAEKFAHAVSKGLPVNLLPICELITKEIARGCDAEINKKTLVQLITRESRDSEIYQRYTESKQVRWSLTAPLVVAIIIIIIVSMALFFRTGDTDLALSDSTDQSLPAMLTVSESKLPIQQVNELPSPSSGALDRSYQQPTPVRLALVIEQPAPASVEDSLKSWIAGWAAQDIESYFDGYHKDYFPRYQASVEEWKEKRRSGIRLPEWIKMELSEFEIIESSAEQQTVRFWLSYCSPTYSDRSHKELVMRLVDNQWLILREMTLVLYN